MKFRPLFFFCFIIWISLIGCHENGRVLIAPYLGEWKSVDTISRATIKIYYEKEQLVLYYQDTRGAFRMQSFYSYDDNRLHVEQSPKHYLVLRGHWLIANFDNLEHKYVKNQRQI